MSGNDFIEGVIAGFDEVGQGFSSAVKTIWQGLSCLVIDAYRVNVTLWDGKPDDGDAAIENPEESVSLLPKELESNSSDSEIETVSVPLNIQSSQNSLRNEGLLRYCHYYRNDSPTIELLGFGLFSVFGGIFYLPWRILKDSVNSAKFHVGIGINHVFFPEDSKPEPKDLRPTAAKITGVFGTVIGMVLRTALYIIAMLGFSPFGYHYLAKAFQQSLSFLFGLNYDNEIRAHDEKLYNHIGANSSKVATISLFLCEVNLAKLANLLVYGLSGVFAGIFGSRQSWHEADRWIYGSGALLFGENALFKDDTILTAEQDRSTWEQDKLKFVSRFGLLPWVVSGLAACAITLAKMANLAFRFFIGSSYSGKKLQLTVKECAAMIFGIGIGFGRKEIQQENEAVGVGLLTTYANRVGLLMRGLQLLTYSISWLTGVLFGNFIAWQRTGKDLKAAVGWVFGQSLSKNNHEEENSHQSTPSPWLDVGIAPFAISCLAGAFALTLNFIGLNAMNYYWLRKHFSNQPEQAKTALANLFEGEDGWVRKVFYHVNLFKIAIYLCFTAFVIIAFSVQAIWKLTFGNFISGEGGYDGYWNRLYYYFKQDSAEAQIEQKLFELLRALSPNGKISEQYSKNPQQILTDAKQRGFGRSILNGFLYDVRKAGTFGHNNLTEKVIIEFTKALTEYVKTEKLTGQHYTTIASSFFQAKKPQQVITKVLPEEAKNDSRQQQAEKVVTFIENLLLGTKGKTAEPTSADDTDEYEKLLGNSV